MRTFPLFIAFTNVAVFRSAISSKKSLGAFEGIRRYSVQTFSQVDSRKDVMIPFLFISRLNLKYFEGFHVTSNTN